MDRLTKEQRRKCMSRIKSKDTKIEIMLRKALWNKGFRYRKNYSKLPGKPDIAITKYNIAIFCDSEFFHGKNWEESLHAQILKGKNAEFWEKKISRNMARDLETDMKLRGLGWRVLRFWGNEIRKHTDQCILALEECIADIKAESSVINSDEEN